LARCQWTDFVYLNADSANGLQNDKRSLDLTG